MSELAVSDGAVSGAVRFWLRAEGLAVLVLSIVLYGSFGARWWLFLALFFAPDLSMLGYLINTKVGAVCYNVVHSYFLPLALATLAMVLGRSNALPYLFIWFAHIGFDRALGFGLKYPTAFGRTHLGSARGLATRVGLMQSPPQSARYS
jgi:hypothetical protein